ncbi:hypothetical protein GCM10023088_58380 [Actinomadura verrucosospora]
MRRGYHGRTVPYLALPGVERSTEVVPRPISGCDQGVCRLARPHPRHGPVARPGRTVRGPDEEDPMTPDDSREPTPTQPPPPDADRTDRSPWNWLLVVPVVLPLLTLLYNSDEPRLAGFPAFYWIQLAFIPLGVACTVLVYQMTKKRG